MSNVFETLSKIDVTSKVKMKNKLPYLPWSSCWEIIKTHYPNATHRIVKDENNNIYHTDGCTAWVEVELAIEDEVQTEMLAVMDFKNAAIPLDKLTSVDVNKAIKRALVKCAALYGLGLSLYYGEELTDAGKKQKEVDLEELNRIKSEIIEMAKNKINSGINKETVYSELEKIIGSKNPNTIKSIDKANKALAAVNNLK